MMWVRTTIRLEAKGEVQEREEENDLVRDVTRFFTPFMSMIIQSSDDKYKKIHGPPQALCSGHGGICIR